MNAWPRTLLALLLIAAPAPAYGLSRWAPSGESEEEVAAGVLGRRTAKVQLGLELGLGELLGRSELYGGFVLRVPMDALGAREPHAKRPSGAAPSSSIAPIAAPRAPHTKSTSRAAPVGSIAPVAEPRTPIAEPRTPIAEPRTPIAEPRTPIAEPRTPLNAAATTSPQGKRDAKPADALPAASAQQGSSERPLTARDLRVAIDAATRRGPFAHDEARLDDFSERARHAAALPELRLRATRLADARASLSPTSYDEERATSSEGASVWLEARAVWTLDRAIFATEELRVERLRQSLAAARDKLSNRVLELVFAWQEAELASTDPATTETECRRAWLRRAQLGAELDLLTGGWLSRRFPASARAPRATCGD